MSVDKKLGKGDGIRRFSVLQRVFTRKNMIEFLLDMAYSQREKRRPGCGGDGHLLLD